MSESDLVKRARERARELLGGLPDQKLNTGSTGIYTVPDTSVTEFSGVPIHCIPREVFIDDDVEHSKTVALVFGDESVYYATLFAEAPQLVAGLLEDFQAAEAERARLTAALAAEPLRVLRERAGELRGMAAGNLDPEQRKFVEAGWERDAQAFDRAIASYTPVTALKGPDNADG